MIHARQDYTDRIVDTANLIPENEPVFLIRGQDILAGDVLRDYANRLENVNGDEKIIKSVRNHAIIMDGWTPKKLPDLPTENITESADETTEDEDETDDDYVTQ